MTFSPLIAGPLPEDNCLIANQLAKNANLASLRKKRLPAELVVVVIALLPPVKS